jgi:hypothetical protein
MIKDSPTASTSLKSTFPVMNRFTLKHSYTNPQPYFTCTNGQESSEYKNMQSPRMGITHQKMGHAPNRRIPSRMTQQVSQYQALLLWTLTFRKHSKEPANEPPIARSVRNLKSKMTCKITPHYSF